MTRLLNEAEAAEILNMKPDTLRRWRYDRRGPAFVKVGGSARYRREDVAEYIRANTVQPRTT